jgi:hypothetical protein
MPAARRLVPLVCLVSIGTGCGDKSAPSGVVNPPAAAVDLNRRPDGHLGPWIGEVTVVNAQAEPLRIDVTLRILDERGNYPSFPGGASLWLCVGVPTKEKSYRDALAAVLKSHDWREGVDVVRGKVFASSVNYVSATAAYNASPEVAKDQFARGLFGRGYAAFVCHEVKRNEDGSFSASMRAAKRNHPGDQVTLMSPDGNESFEASYPAVELPVSWLIWDEQTDRISNERRGILNLKAGRLVRLMPD